MGSPHSREETSGQLAILGSLTGCQQYTQEALAPLLKAE